MLCGKAPTLRLLTTSGLIRRPSEVKHKRKIFCGGTVCRESTHTVLTQKGELYVMNAWYQTVVNASAVRNLSLSPTRRWPYGVAGQAAPSMSPLWPVTKGLTPMRTCQIQTIFSPKIRSNTMEDELYFKYLFKRIVFQISILKNCNFTWGVGRVLPIFS